MASANSGMTSAFSVPSRVELDSDGREARLGGAEDLHDRGERRDRLDRQPDDRLDLSAEREPEPAERVRALDDRGGALVEDASSVGQRGAVARAVEQHDAELALEIADELAHRRL